MPAVREGKLEIDDAGHKIYYRLFGEGKETLVGLHGGPGADHRYLERLGELAGGDLQVLIYDQLGSRLSDHPEGNSFWTVEHFVEELDIIRKKMELGRVHLLGQSWGGMLALQYALDHPEGIKSLIPSNIGASTVEIVKGMHRRRLELPPHIYREMLKHEGAGDFNSPEYEELVFEFYCRFTRRSTPFEPARSLKECKELLGPTMGDIGPAYYYMWGPNEFTCSGTLLDWDVTDRLGEIKVPALILCGQYDECVPEIHQTMADLIPDNEFVMFGNSSHVIILEKEANAYLATIKDFVTRVTKSQ